MHFLYILLVYPESEQCIITLQGKPQISLVHCLKEFVSSI